METNELLSLIFTILSMMFYSVVFIPQFVKIYKIKHSDGISIWTILMWCQADTLSLLGTLILQLNLGLIIIGWYHMLVGELLLIYILRMQTNSNLYRSIFVYIFVFTNFFISLFFQIYINNFTNIIAGQILGWFCSFIYIFGRMPQIYYNYKRKSVEGLSILLYIFSILGNICYILSIIIYSSELYNIILNLPWIVLTIVTGILDIFVIFQSRIYKVNVDTESQSGSTEGSEYENKNKSELQGKTIQNFYEIV